MDNTHTFFMQPLKLSMLPVPFCVTVPGLPARWSCLLDSIANFPTVVPVSWYESSTEMDTFKQTWIGSTCDKSRQRYQDEPTTEQLLTMAYAVADPRGTHLVYSPPPYFTEPNFVYIFLYVLVKAKLAYNKNYMHLICIFRINLLL